MSREWRRAPFVAMGAGLLCCMWGAAAAETVANFYRQNDLTIIVPSSAGGINALYAKTVGVRWGDYIPGNPKIVYRFMPGDGGRTGTNHCYKSAPKDASTVCLPLNSFVFAQLIRPDGIEYRAHRFHYLGSASDMNGAFAVWHDVPVKSLLEARNTQIYLLGAGKASAAHDDPFIVNSLFGTKFKVVSGFRGGDGLEVSARDGEFVGRAASLLSWTMRKPHWIRSNRIRFLAQVGLRRMPDFLDVPLLTEFARSPDERQILRLISARGGIGRPFVAPPGSPQERVAALRAAFSDTMKDPTLVANMKARGLHHQWSDGETLRQLVTSVLATPKSIVARVREMLEGS